MPPVIIDTEIYGRLPGTTALDYAFSRCGQCACVNMICQLRKAAGCWFIDFDIGPKLGVTFWMSLN